MRNIFDNGFVDIDDIMPDSENNKIRELSEEEKQQYLEEKIKKSETDAICPESKYYKSVVNKEYDDIAKKALNI